MLGEQLKQIADLQVSASNAAQLLTSAMRDNRQRGQWGEVALRTVVEMAGLTAGVHFTEQQSVEGEEGRLRPDMIVRLPGVRCIAIDSKVPLNAYLESINPTITDAARKDFRVAHANALRTHVRALSAKEYAKAIDGDVEFTLLFIPIESAFTAAFETDPSIHPEAMQKKVLVVTPSTLLALLRTVAMHWSNAKLAENAEAIGKEAKKLADCIGLFVEHINSVSGKLTGVNKSFNEAVGSFERRLVPSAKRLANLVAAEEVELDDTIVATPRVITFDQSEDASA
jgi:DNA recombination protein RmuC